MSDEIMQNSPPASGAGDAPAPAEPAAEQNSKRLFVRPIENDTQLDDVEALFAKVGPVTDISLKPGYGFIEYANSEDADKAVKDLNGDASFGYAIHVERAMVRGARREPRVAAFRIEVHNVPSSTSWQDLKDLARTREVEAVFTNFVDAGFGVIDVATTEERDSLLTLNSTEWQGTTLELREDPNGAPPPPARRPREGGRGGGRGGRGGDRGGRGRGGRGRGFDRGGGRGRFGGDRFGGNDRYNDRRGSDRGGDRFGDRGDRSRERYGDRQDRRNRDRSRSPPRRDDGPSW